MPLPRSARARRTIVGASIGALGAALAAIVLLATGVIAPFDSPSRQEADIRSAVDGSGIAASYELTRMPAGASSTDGYALTLSLDRHASADSTGTLMSTLFADSLRVESIDLVYGPAQRIHVTNISREAAQWAALVDFGRDLIACDGELTQLGPNGMATYRLDLDSTTSDPAAVYEHLLDASRPEWVTFGDVHVTTPNGMWPKRSIQAGRELTADELAQFEALDAQLGSEAGPNEAYEVEVISILGHDDAEFRSRIVPDATAPTFSLGTGHEPVIPDPTPEDAP